MFWNNIKIAIRNLRKHKGFAAINIIGLAIGLTTYIFGGLLIHYEETHDSFFENSANIYTVGATAAPDLGMALNTAYITGLGTTDQRMIILVDIEKFMSSDDMALIERAVEQ